MLTALIRNELLVDELQLGNRLNEDVQSENHADFSLMLAMLSHDIIDHPLYNTPEKVNHEVDLRKKFSLLPEQKKYATDEDFDRAQSMTEAFSEQGMRQVFLAQCMQNEPLVPYQRTYSPEVFAQLTPLKQEKLRREQEGAAITYEKIRETGNGFGILEEINSSRIQSRIEATA